jgi:mannitol-1-phosphate 5-dehydrogenase
MGKKAVIYGGGNIGRGFVGQLFYESGYETAFIDINKELVSQLNEKKEYPIKFTDNLEIIIKNVRGINGSPENSDEVSDAVSDADIMATAVGATILKFIMQPVAEGINKRFARENFYPLNIILCENLIGADKIMREGVRAYINDDFQNLYNEKIGFIEASVGRMVPVQTDEMKAGNPLRIVTESYKSLPVDKDAWKGEMPEIKNIIACAPFEYLIRRKLFIHNMGHAVCAYLGDICGHEYIWQAVRDEYVKNIVVKAMESSALALSKIYQADISDLNAYISDLTDRFGNKALGDTVNRVGNDLKRKLSPDDRIVGAYKMCLETGVPVDYLCLAVAAAVNFKGDRLSGKSLEDILKEAGSFDLLAANHDNFALMKKYDDIIKNGKIKNLSP